MKALYKITFAATGILVTKPKVWKFSGHWWLQIPGEEGVKMFKTWKEAIGAVILAGALLALSGCAARLHYGDSISCPRYNATGVEVRQLWSQPMVRVEYPDRAVYDVSSDGCVIKYYQNKKEKR